jgi:16S rRNA (uracil1498-N3)-methyltransferase
VKLEPARAGARTERLQRIAAEAARQSGRADVPEVESPRSLDSFLQAARERGEAVAALWEGEAPRLSSWLAGEPGPVALLVGPEGGIAPGERDALKAAGAAEVSLGRRILRTETAGLAALAVALHLRGELG